MVSPAPKTPTTVKTPTAPTFKTPGMSLSPQFGGVLKTPTMPSIGATNKTPVQQTGKVVNKSEQLSLFPKGESIVRQPLGIVPSTVNPNNMRPGQQHTPDTRITSQIPPLFHGSSSTIKSGELIKPGGKYSPEFAYSTGDIATAGTYAVGRGQVRGDKGQGTLWDVIHAVEPVNPPTTYKDASPHGKNTDSYVSREGFKSKGPIALIDNTGRVTGVPSNKEFREKYGSIYNPKPGARNRPANFEQGKLDFGSDWVQKNVLDKVTTGA